MFTERPPSDAVFRYAVGVLDRRADIIRELKNFSFTHHSAVIMLSHRKKGSIFDDFTQIYARSLSSVT